MFEGSSLSPKLLKRLELLNFRTRRSFLGTKQGGHISPRKGHGIEFSDFRQYELGDSPRNIDWGVYARTDKLFVRRYQEEQDLSVLILIDTSASIFFPKEDRKWDRIKDIVLSLSYVALMNQDTVTIGALGQESLPHYYGARAIHSINRELQAIKPLPQGTPRALAPSVLQCASRVRFPGVAILISDFLMDFSDFEQSINILRSKNLSTVAIQSLGETDLRPLANDVSSHCIDSETGEEIELLWDARQQKEYETGLTVHNNRLRAFCHSSGIRFSQDLSSVSIEDFILNELPKTGILE